jgi:LysR family glycine cleavage system transcriptional activator
VSLASLWLAPRLPAFTDAYPGIDVRLSSVIWDDPVPSEATDLEIRYGTGQWRGYRAERLLNQSIVAVCSPALLESTRSSGEAAGLVPKHLIHIMGHENHWLQVRQALQVADVATRVGPTVDTTIAALELAAHGAGCALAHRIFLTPYLATGRLVAAIDRDFADENSYFVVTPERPQRTRREVQLLRDWLTAIAAN